MSKSRSRSYGVCRQLFGLFLRMCVKGGENSSYCSHPLGAPVTYPAYFKSPSARGWISWQILLYWPDAVQQGARRRVNSNDYWKQRYCVYPAGV